MRSEAGVSGTNGPGPMVGSIAVPASPSGGSHSGGGGSRLGESGSKRSPAAAEISAPRVDAAGLSPLGWLEVPQEAALEVLLDSVQGRAG